MEKSITVKGIGSVSRKPDRIEIPIRLCATSADYKSAVEKGAVQLEELLSCVIRAGFDKETLKTTAFEVSPDHESYYDSKGNYRQKMKGYTCRQSLKLDFPLDMKRLGETIEILSACTCRPEFNIRFKVGNSEDLCAEMLEAAARNARSKAEILCRASGVRLGALMNISYNWGELDVYSQCDIGALPSPTGTNMKAVFTEMNPEEIEASDTATFVWNIE